MFLRTVAIEAIEFLTMFANSHSNNDSIFEMGTGIKILKLPLLVYKTELPLALLLYT